MDWKDLLKKLGINSTQLQWRWLQLQRDIGNTAKSLETRAEQLNYRNKVCSGCGAILDHDDLYCPRCSTKAPSWREEVARKAIGPTSGLNVTTWIMMVIMVNEALSLIHGEGAWLPSAIHGGELLRAHGALDPDFVRAGEWWRMISAGYLHIGLLHIAFNAAALWQLGNLIENELGPTRFFTIYTLCLLGGSTMDLIVGQHSAGASGALFGLIGFGLTYAHFNGNTALRNQFLQYAFIGVIYAIIRFIDSWGHLGGFLTGLVLGAVVFGEGGWHAQLDKAWLIASRICLALTVLSLALMLRNLVTSSWLTRADAELQAQNTEKAIAIANRVLWVDPFNGMAVYLRAEAHQADKDYADAVDDASRLIWLAPQDPRGYAVRAYNDYALEQYSKAADDARTSLQWGKGTVDVYSVLGDANVKTGHYDAALEAYTQALVAGGESRAGEFYYKRGNANYLDNHPQQAQIDWGTASMYGSAEARVNLRRIRTGRVIIP